MLPTYEGVVQQGRIRLPAGLALPEGARVYVTVVPTLDERAARRKANGWLGEHVGNMVMARQPTMVAHATGRPVWRFGAFVGSLSSEPFGPIGYVEVDAESGQILTDVAEAERMAERGERLEHVESPR